MKSFICINCGNQVKRPSMPMRCDQCGQARVGLFKAAPAGQSGAATPAPTPSTPAAPQQPAGGGMIPPPPPPPGGGAPSAPSTPAASSPPPLPQQPTQPAAPASPAPPADAGGKGFSQSIAPPPTPGGGSGAASSPSPPQQAPTPQQPKQAPEQPKQPAARPTAPAEQPKATPQPKPKSKPKADSSASPPAAKPKSASAPAAKEQPKPKPKPKPKPAEKQPAEKKTASTGPGTVVWTYPKLVPGQDVGLTSLRNCVAIDDNRQILVAQGGRLIALAETEEQPRELWDYPTRDQIPGCPTVGPDGNIRVHSNDGLLHCLTPHGEPAFTPVKCGEPLGWAAPLVDDENHTWVCSYTGGLIRIDSKGNRSSAPFFRSRQKFDSTGVIHNGVLYVGGEDAFVYAVRITGSRGKNEWDHTKDRGKTEWFINTAIAMTSAGLFIVAGRDEYLYAFDDSGQQIWREHLRGQMLGSPVIDEDDNIYVGVSLIRRGEEPSGKLVSISGKSHAARWEYETGSAIESTPVIGKDGMIYVGSNDGRIHGLNLAGELQWTANAGSPVRSAGSISPSGRVIFGTDRGTLVAVAATSTAPAEAGWPKLLRTLKQSGRSHEK